MEPKFCTLHQAAQNPQIPFSEYALRRLAKAGKLPCVYSGTRCLVNLPRLIEQVENAPGNLWTDVNGGGVRD